MERLQGTKYSELKNTSSEAFRVTKERKVINEKKKKKEKKNGGVFYRSQPETSTPLQQHLH